MTTLLPGPLVPPEWLAAHLGDVAVVDVRWYLDGRSGRDAYLAGHLPGAVWLDIDHDLAGPPTPAGGRHPLPDPDRFAAALSAHGIGDDTEVVAYDDAGGSIAARLWWMLHTLGHRAAVLDGGLAAWDGPLTTGAAAATAAATAATTAAAATAAVPARPTHCTARPWPQALFLDAAEVERVRHDPATLVIDARAAGRYQGEPHPADPRPGHIPGARSGPWAANLDAATGRFLPPAELAARYQELGVGEAEQVVAYCGSGVTACHDLLALRVAGFDTGALFTGSWSAWGADPARPAQVEPDPGDLWTVS